MPLSMPPRENASPQERIHLELCSRILSGKLSPGGKLPSIMELKEEFDVAILTIQRVLARLKADGVTIGIRGKGTFVSPTAPCVNRIGLVFPCGQEKVEASHFFGSLKSAAELQSAANGWEIAYYYSQGETLDPVEHQRLVEDITWCRLSGILFAVHPFELNGTLPMAQHLPIPRVAIMSSQGYPDICAICPDQYSFCHVASTELKERGCRQCACIATIHWPLPILETLQTDLRAKGLSLPIRWLQAVPHQEPQWARNCAHQLFCEEQGDRPDCLIITDDHLVEASLEGLRETGLRPGDDVQVIAYRNAPSRQPDIPGVCYLGADMEELVCQAHQIMMQKRLQQPYPQALALPAKFHDTQHLTCNAPPRL